MKNARKSEESLTYSTYLIHLHKNDSSAIVGLRNPDKSSPDQTAAKTKLDGGESKISVRIPTPRNCPLPKIFACPHGMHVQLLGRQNDTCRSGSRTTNKLHAFV